MSNFDIIIVFCTVPDKVTAKNISIKVLAEKLAVCVTIFPGVFSFYYWEGKLQQKSEVQIVLKTDIAHQKALFTYLKNCHPYQNPELLSLPIVNIDEDYLSWLKNFLK